MSAYNRPPVPYLAAPTGVFAGVSPFSYPSASAATSSRQKSEMSGTTRPQTRMEVIEKRENVSPEASSAKLSSVPSPDWSGRWYGAGDPPGGERRVALVPNVRYPARQMFLRAARKLR